MKTVGTLSLDNLNFKL